MSQLSELGAEYGSQSAAAGLNVPDPGGTSSSQKNWVAVEVIDMFEIDDNERKHSIPDAVLDNKETRKLKLAPNEEGITVDRRIINGVKWHRVCFERNGVTFFGKQHR